MSIEWSVSAPTDTTEKYVLRLSTSLTMLNNLSLQGYFNIKMQKCQGVDRKAIPFLWIWLTC